MRTSILLIPLAGMLSCSVALASPQSQAPQAEIPSRLSLADALRIAATQSPALVGAEQQRSLAEADVLGARQRLNPSAAVTSEGWSPGASGAGSRWNRQEFSLELSQEIDTSGRRSRRVAVAAAGLAASQSGIDEQRRQLRLRVQQAYFQLAVAQSEVESAGLGLAEFDKLIAVNRARYQQGEVSGGELRRMEVERLRFTDEGRQADLSERQARSALLALLGAVRLDQPLSLTDGRTRPGEPGGAAAPPAAAAPAPHLDAAVLAERAIAARPDLTALRHERERAAAEIRLQQASRRPNMTAGAGYRRDFGENGLIATLSVPLPFFDRNAAGVARAEAESRLVAARTREQETAVRLEVQQAVTFVEVSRARLSDIESAYLQKAREARDSAMAAYRAGATDLIDLLDAQRSYREVQRAHLRAWFDYQVGLCELESAIGAPSGGLLP